MGGFLNISVWYHAKNLKIFDEEESPKGSSNNKEVELKTMDSKSQEK